MLSSYARRARHLLPMSTPPYCTLPPVLGLQYPQPTALEFKNLVEFFDLLQSKGMKVHLRLVNTHMEEQPPEIYTLWIGSILKAIKNHPALDLVLFEGSPFTFDNVADSVPINVADLQNFHFGTDRFPASKLCAMGDPIQPFAGCPIPLGTCRLRLSSETSTRSIRDLAVPR